MSRLVFNTSRGQITLSVGGSIPSLSVIHWRAGMREMVLEKLRRLCDNWLELARALPPDAFGQSLPVSSNSIGAQLWCVVGARESYLRAIEAGQWQGFACSLSGADTADQAEVTAALERSAAGLLAGMAAVEWDSARDSLLLDLLEHEAQHQGQLIRYVYGLGYSFPQSWKQRWALG